MSARVAALKVMKLAAGLKMADLFSEKQAIRRNAGARGYREPRKKKNLAVYNYVSINGEYAYTKIRRLEGKKKCFSECLRMDGLNMA